MAHGVVRTDNMIGTDVRSELVSIKYEEDIDNGNVLKVGDLISGEREIFEGLEPEADDALSDIVLLAAPEVMYDERKRNLDDYYNEAGKAIRGYRLHKGDIFSLTKDALDGAEDPVEGNVVELQDGTMLNVVSTATDGSTVVGKIIHKEIVGRYTYYAILVG